MSTADQLKAARRPQNEPPQNEPPQNEPPSLLKSRRRGAGRSQRLCTYRWFYPRWRDGRWDEEQTSPYSWTGHSWPMIIAFRFSIRSPLFSNGEP